MEKLVFLLLASIVMISCDSKDYSSKNNNALINDAKIRIPIEIQNFNSIKPIFEELKNTQKSNSDKS